MVYGGPIEHVQGLDKVIVCLSAYKEVSFERIQKFYYQAQQNRQTKHKKKAAIFIKILKYPFGIM